MVRDKDSEMNLWCRKCETHTEHSVKGTFTSETTKGRKIAKEHRIDFTPNNGAVPIFVNAVCGCGGKDWFVCNSNSVTESS